MRTENFYSQEKEPGSFWWVVMMESFDDGVLVETKQIQTPMSRVLADAVATSYNDVAYETRTHIACHSDGFGDWKPEHGKKAPQSISGYNEQIA